MNVKQHLASLTAFYGDGADGAAPTPAQWRRVLEREESQPFALINFFKFRTYADYGAGKDRDLTGAAAFDLYAEVSVPAMERAGGAFLAVAPFGGTFLGGDEDWDLVAIGKYPNLTAFLALYEDEAYQAAFHHRTAAVAKQVVGIMKI